MIHEFELYHGAVFRSIIVGSEECFIINKKDYYGRINSFIINRSIAIHIKHSSKRLPSWQFSFGIEQLQELHQLAQNASSVWIPLVCGLDGIVSLSLEELVSVTEARPGGVASVRVDRSRGGMYRVYGNKGVLPTAKRRGVTEILNEITQTQDK